MKNSLIAFFAGLIFAIGLGISGMTQPQKVIGFLDFFGNWDPSLGFVMLGAIAIHFSAYRFVPKMGSPFFSKEWFLPTDSDFPPSLIVGSFIFGIGWGLGGFCPGPALVSLVSMQPPVLIFVVAMLTGMLAARLFKNSSAALTRQSRNT